MKIPSTYLYHVVERFLVLGPEHLPDVQHVDLAAGHHDADQRIVSCAQPLQQISPCIKPGMAKQPCSAHLGPSDRFVCLESEGITPLQGRAEAQVM